MTGKSDSENPQNSGSADSEAKPAFDKTFAMPERAESADAAETNNAAPSSAQHDADKPDQPELFGRTFVGDSGTDPTEAASGDADDTSQSSGGDSQSGLFTRTAVTDPGASASEQQDKSLFDSTVVGSPHDPPVDDVQNTVVAPTETQDQKPDAQLTDSMMASTFVHPVSDQFDATQIFTRSMGMRGLSEEEYNEWQQEREEKSQAAKTAIVRPEDGDSVAGRSTQIWSRQSADGLDNALTIRNRPVSGQDLARDDEQPDYQIVGKLAEGGMGVVYIARQTSLDRELAVKTLKPLSGLEKAQHEATGRLDQVNQQRREMFLSEALVTANLVHPNIIPIHDLCQTDDGYPFYSMKRVQGVPWSDLISTMTQEENLDVLLKVSDAIAYAHHYGVVNRDLKPENIMLGEFGEVMVLDWGLAVPAMEEDRKRVASTAASFGAGTPAYMSPELWAGPPSAIGTWSDIYLLGAILYEIITGCPPHEFPNPPQGAGNSAVWGIIDSVVRHNSIRETCETGELVDIAMKAMQTEPKQRYETVLAFQLAVRNYQKHEESRRLTQRADELVGGDRPSHVSQGYNDYQTATALYEEARHAWADNYKARDGLRITRLGYADLAYRKGDYDLGLQIVAQEKGDDFRTLERKLRTARKVRSGLKWTTIMAFAAIVVVGAYSFVQGIRIQRQNLEITEQNEEIRQLFGDKESLEQQKQSLENEKGALEQEKVALVADKEELVAQTAELVREAEDLGVEKAALLVERDDLQQDKQRLGKEMMGLEVEKTALQSERNQLLKEKDSLVVEKSELEQSKQQLETDKTQLEKQIQDVAAEVASLTEQKVRAAVDLKYASISSLIRNADYSTAIEKIDSLLLELNSQSLSDLPEQERKQRIIELQARQRQLQQRARANTTPVQTQAVSPDGSFVVWGDSSGTITRFYLDPTQSRLPAQATSRLQLEVPISEVQLSTDGHTVLAIAENQLHAWDSVNNQSVSTTTPNGVLTSVLAKDDVVLTSSADGTIAAWMATDLQPLWSVRSSSAIRDMILVPQSDIIIFAGSRGGQSADVLAYRLPQENTVDARPERLGQLRLPRNRNHPPAALAVSPDGQLLLISNTRNGEVLALPRRAELSSEARDQFPFEHAATLAESGDTHWVLEHHQRPVNHFAFSADGSRLATASDDRSIGVWQQTDTQDSLLSLKFLKRLEGHGAKVNSVAFWGHRDDRLLSASADRFCRLWELDRYEQQHQAIQEDLRLNASAEIPARSPLKNDRYNLPGRSSLSSGRTSGNAARNPGRAHSRWLLTSDRRGGFSPDESQFTAKVRADTDPQGDYIVLNSGNSVQRGSLKSVFMSPDGTRAVTGAADGTAVIWDIQSGQPVTRTSRDEGLQSGSVRSFDEGHDFNVSRLRFLPPDGTSLLTTGFDGNLCLWNADIHRSGAGIQRQRLPGLGLVNAFAVAGDGSVLVTSADTSVDGKPGTCLVWRTTDLLKAVSPEPLARLSGLHQNEISALAVSPDGRQIVTGARDGRVGLWSTADEKLIASGRLHAKDTIVSHLEWLSDGSILSAGFDGRLQVCKAAPQQQTLETVLSMKHDRIPIERIAFAPDRSHFITNSVRTDTVAKTTAYELHLWSVADIEPIRKIHPAVVEGQLPRIVSSASWSPDGSRVAIVVDGNLQILETEGWRVQRVLDAPGLGISDAVFAPAQLSGQRQRLATFDGTAAHLWDLQDGRHLTGFRPLFAVSAAVLADNHGQSLLLTGDRTVRGFQATSSSPEYGRPVFKLADPHLGIVTSIAVAPNSPAGQYRFATAGADGSAAIWNWNSETQTIDRIRDLPSIEGRIAELSWSPDGGRLLQVAENGIVHLHAVSSPESDAIPIRIGDATDRQPGDSSYRLMCGRFSADGNSFAVAGQVAESGESIGWVYSVHGQQKPHLHCTFSGHESGGVHSLGFVPDSPYLVSGGADGAVIVWNWQPEQDDALLQAYEAYQFLGADRTTAHAAAVNMLSVSSDGNVLSASEDGIAIVWKNPFRSGDSQ